MAATKLNQSSTSEDELILVRRIAFWSLFVVAGLDGIAWLLFANLPLVRWLFFAASMGVPLAIWIVADARMRDLLKHPWQPLAAFLLWPAVLPLYVYRTRGWSGIGALCLLCAAMYGIKLITAVSLFIVLLVLNGFPGPGFYVGSTSWDIPVFLKTGG